LKVAAKGRTSPAEQLADMMAAGAKNFQDIIYEYQHQNENLAARLSQVEDRVAALEQERAELQRQRSNLTNKVRALQDRNSRHDADRFERGLPALAYPRGTNISDLMGQSYVTDYLVDDPVRNRGTDDQYLLGNDAKDTASLRGEDDVD
jgi:TolA-binding protein